MAALLQSHRVVRRGRRLLRRGRGHPRPHREGRGPGRAASRRGARRDRAGGRLAHRRAAAGPARGGLAHARRPPEALPAHTPGLQVADVEARLDALAATSGTGSTARRAGQLEALFGAATAEEQRFLQRLFTGELRQGALEGVMLEAVAAAAEVPATTVRRAFFLSGRLPNSARLALAGGAAALEAVSPEVGRPVRPMLASPAESLDAALAELRPGGERRVQAGRRPHPGAPRRRRGAGVDAHAARGHRPRARAGGAGPAGCPVVASCWTARPSRCRTTAARARSRRPRAASGPTATSCRRARFLHCLHLDGADLIDEPLSARLEALERAAGVLGKMPGRAPPVDGVEASALLEKALADGPRGRDGQGPGRPVRRGPAGARRGRR